MGKWMKRIMGVMLAAVVAFGLTPASVGLAYPEGGNDQTYEDLENYANDNFTFLAGTSGYTRAYRADDAPPFTSLIEEDGGFYSKYIGYRIYDFDMDGVQEMLVVSLEEDTYNGVKDVIALSMYEWFSETPTQTAVTLLPYGENYTPLMSPVGASGGYQPVIDVFAYTAADTGQVYICVESETATNIQADGRVMNFAVYTYSDYWSFDYVDGGHYAGSDGVVSKAYMDALEGVGITGANWDDLFSQYALIGHYAKNYQSIVRITLNPLLPDKDLSYWLQYGNLLMRVSRVDFSMPWQREEFGAPNLDMLKMMLAGFSTFGGDYFTREAFTWHEGYLLNWAYNMFVLDILDVESNYLTGEDAVDLSVNAFYYKPIGDNWYTLDQGQVELLVRSLAGTCPTYISDTDFFLSGNFYAENGTVYIHVDPTQEVFPNLVLLIDTVYVENGYEHLTGNVFNTTSVFPGDSGSYECVGRFDAVVDETVFSIFGAELESLVISGKPVYAANLKAVASSFLPDQDGFTYGPELVLDGKTDTAWNEGAAGDGLGEWLQLFTLNGGNIPVTGIQVLSGYHKSDSVYNANGKPYEYEVEKNGKYWFTWDVWYDNVIGFGEVADVNSLRFTISSLIPGTLYDDTCVTEIRVLTADPLSQLPPYGTGLNYPSGSGSTATFIPPTKEPESTSVSSGDYILPESNVRLYTSVELAGLDKATLRLARNEIYARHGRRFNSPDLQAYFDSKPWYNGTIAPADFDNNVLNSFELANIKLIESLE